MKDLLETMNQLDSQLTILNIEGYASECSIYTWDETELDENVCNFCNGHCECETYYSDGKPD